MLSNTDNILYNPNKTDQSELKKLAQMLKKDVFSAPNSGLENIDEVEVDGRRNEDTVQKLHKY
tara:strand:+ start:58 stop:246 length:189 start_codon:yes stop_codon:yes gene_type:complete